MKTITLLLALSLSAFAKPTLWIIGDSTVRNNTPGQQGWGDPLAARFDQEKINVSNKAIGGRSSRSFLTEGRWDEIVRQIKPGDFVLMQFGHNDGGERFKGDRPRASIKGNGDETDTGVVEATGERETVRSYGWYLRKYAADAISKGATPVILSPIPRNRRDDNGRIYRASRDYGLWARQAAEQAGALFIDLNSLLAEAYDELGAEGTDALFAVPDHTHTRAEGAAFNAKVVAGAIRSLPGSPLNSFLKP